MNYVKRARILPGSAKEPGRMREIKPEKARPFTAVLVFKVMAQ